MNEVRSFVGAHHLLPPIGDKFYFYRRIYEETNLKGGLHWSELTNMKKNFKISCFLYEQQQFMHYLHMLNVSLFCIMVYILFLMALM